MESSICFSKIIFNENIMRESKTDSMLFFLLYFLFLTCFKKKMLLSNFMNNLGDNVKWADKISECKFGGCDS